MITSPPKAAPGPTPTVNNHYVAEWFQRRFLTLGATQFHYLDLDPAVVEYAPGRKYRRSEILRRGPAKCFCQPHLYTMRFGGALSDVLEHRFFGPIDYRGKSALEHYAHYQWPGAGPLFEDFVRFVDAQRLRTPRGLDLFKRIAGVDNDNIALLALQQLHQMNATMWTEAIWEIVNASHTKTKFLLTDNPVTFYNKKVFPGSPFCVPPFDAQLSWAGTRTIFPLGLERCLILTHVQLVRNPWINPLKARVNPRMFEDAMFDLRNVQTGRELEEDEVLRINLILKKRAHRYIAACEPEWLYPERLVSTLWSKLDDDWFLFPHLYKVPFSSGMAVDYEGGHSEAWDDHGRRPWERGYRDSALHDAEWKSHLKAQREWAIRRRGKSRAHVAEFDAAGDSLMDHDISQYLRRREDQRAARRQGHVG